MRKSKDAAGRYLGLVGGALTSIQTEGGMLVVKSDIAAEQLRKDAEAQQQADATKNGATPTDQAGDLNQTTGVGQPGGAGPAAPAYRRFHGSIPLDSIRVGRDAGRIADEVIQHLTKLVGADVRVTLEIQARLQEGASDKTIRDITENCRTLRFDSFGFEEE